MYARIHGTITWHRKTLAVSDAALGVWVRLLGHCAEHLTDGFVPEATARAVSSRSPRALQALLQAGFIEPTDGGYRLHNYLEHNASREQIEAGRIATRNRVKRRRSATCNAVTTTVTNAVTNGVRTALVTPAVTGAVTLQEVEVEEEVEDSLRSSVAREASPSLSDSTTTSPQLSLVTPPQSSAKGAGAPDRPKRRAKPHPVEDRAPEDGTDAARVYEVITRDDLLRPITAAPGEFARRVTDGAYPGVDVVAEIKRAAEWLDSKRGTPQGAKSDGRAFLRNWLQGKADRIAAMPKPASAPQVEPRRTDHRPNVVLDGGAKLIEGPSLAERWANVGKAVKK